MGQFSSMDIGPDGMPHVAYYDATENALKHAWGKWNPVSAAWDWREETVDSEGNVGQHTSIAVADGGTLHIAYYSPGNGGVLKHALGTRVASRGEWTWSVTLASDPASGSAGQYSSLALDSDGNPHVAYFLGGLNALAHSWGTWDSGERLSEWRTEIVDNNGFVGEYASLAIDSDDTLNIAYFDKSSGALKYAAGTAAPGAGDWAWDTRLLDDPEGEIVGKHTSIAVNRSGAVYIAYYDETNGNLKLARGAEVSIAVGQAGPPPSCALSLSLRNPPAQDCEGLEEDATLVVFRSWVDYFRTRNPQHNDIFVNDSECGEDADGSMRRPFCNLQDAMAMAKQVPEATIRLDPGTYQLSVEVLRNVSIEALSTTNTTLKGLFVVGRKGDSQGQGPSLSIKGVTLVGEGAPVAEVNQGSLNLHTVRVDVKDGPAIVASGPNAELRIGNSEVITSDPVVTTPADTQSGAGMSSQEIAQASCAWVCAQNGAHLLMDNVCLEAESVAVLIDGPATTATISSSVIKNTRLDPAGQFGYGVAVQGGASASIVGSTLVANSGVGTLVDGPGSSISIRATHIGQTSTNTLPGTGVGAMVQNGAAGTIVDSAFVSNEAPGLYVSNGATGNVTGSVFEANGFSGISVVDASATLDGNSIISSGPSLDHGGGVGVFTWRLDEDQPFDLVLRSNLVEEQPGSAAYLRDSKIGLTLLIEGNLFRNNGTPPVPGGVFLQGSLDGVTISANCFKGSTQYGLLADAPAVLSGNYYEVPLENGGVDYTIKQQSCDASSPPVTPIDISQETLLPSPNYVLICPPTASPTQPLLEFSFSIEELEVG